MTGKEKLPELLTIMDEREKYNQALAFATKKHEGQFRIGGEAYITHPVAVAQLVKEQGYGLEYQITALFHDLLEDTDAKEEEIEEIGGKDVLKAVKLLTKDEGYIMEEYIDAIKKNPIAFVVKGADRLHNLRSAFCTDSEFRRKYIIETNDWYLDFSKQIREAVEELAQFEICGKN